jgi:glycosyltransferase involved in cell wall biosynthesis
MAIFAPVRCQQIMYWTGDGSEQFLNFGLGDRRSREKIDLLLTASTWHREDLCRASGFPIEKTFVVGNGVHLPFYEKDFARNRKRLIYTSAPYRGLALVPQLYSELLTRINDLELTVISGFEIYDRELPFRGGELQGTKEILSLLQTLPGCVVKGNMTQQQLAGEYLQAGLFFYPNTVRETCCITALEAQAAGCPVITSNLGALKETVGDGGIVIFGEPGSRQYNHDFIEAAERLLTDQECWWRFSNRAQQRIRENYSWERVADRFEEAFTLKFRDCSTA